MTLLADLAGLPNAAKESSQISDYIATIRGTGCGSLSKSAIEKEYGVRFSRSDDEADIRAAVVSETAVKCLEVGHENRRRWVLHRLIEVCIHLQIVWIPLLTLS